MKSTNANTKELDFTSPHFNAAKALKEPLENIELPRPSAQIYDNLSCFIENEDGIFPKERKPPSTLRWKMKESTSSATEEQTGEKQSAEIAQQRKPKKVKNVLTQMDTTVKGPLTFLKKCMDEKLRVKVFTRGPVDIRGFCIGYVEAFDKHWNLVLKDVLETWMRKRRRKRHSTGPVRTSAESCEKSDEEAAAAAAAAADETEDESKILRSRERELRKTADVREGRKTEIDEYRKPKTVVRKRLKRKELCERHVDQMLIRGEQIVIVRLDSS